MRISDWSSDVCSSDLPNVDGTFRLAQDSRDSIGRRVHRVGVVAEHLDRDVAPHAGDQLVEAHLDGLGDLERTTRQTFKRLLDFRHQVGLAEPRVRPLIARSEEHTSELQSLMRITYAVFC